MSNSQAEPPQPETKEDGAVPEEKAKKKPKWRSTLVIAAATLLAGAGGGFGIGRWVTPPEVVTETETVTRQVVPPACHQTLVSMHELIKKREEQVKNLNEWAEILGGSRDWDMPTVAAFKTLFVEQTSDLTQKVDADLTVCNTFL